MATTLGTLNPFRYRGYVYDEETALYYLRSRYYNPTWDRFMNGDIVLGKIGSLNSHNIYAYCKNSPTLMIDPNGKSLCSFDAMMSDSAGGSYFESVIKPRIMAFLNDVADYYYHKNLFRKAKYDSNGSLITSGYSDCSHLLYEVTDVGSITARYRYEEFTGTKGDLFDKNGNLQVELEEGMEVYKTRENGRIYHCGILMLYDFGDGLEWAVFQSASCKITKSKALFSGDTGPNITSLYELDGTTGWSKYTAPQF